MSKSYASDLCHQDDFGSKSFAAIVSSRLSLDLKSGKPSSKSSCRSRPSLHKGPVHAYTYLRSHSRCHSAKDEVFRTRKALLWKLRGKGSDLDCGHIYSGSTAPHPLTAVAFRCIIHLGNRNYKYIRTNTWIQMHAEMDPTPASRKLQGKRTAHQVGEHSKK